MDRATLVRRGFHLASPVWLVWYWMPPDAGIGMRKELVLLLLLCGALLIEATRLITGRQFLGMRDYEANRVSAYAWGALGLAIGLLFFPGQIVIVTFWGMAWIDPLAGWARRDRGYPWVPFLGYLALAVILSLGLVPTAPYRTSPWNLGLIAAFAPLAAVVALAAERPNLKHVDDDFLMHVAPMITLAILSAMLGIDNR